ncbi:MAG: deoxyribodipyrimidine photo-lyase [Bacteroidetes bacterium]|nr:deoxyribodipyrimidine photo-lyase [Bacteroidota bacterium]
MKIKSPLVIFWFRRDLRLIDNAGLWAALSGEFNVFPVFIFDTCILNKLDKKTDTRISFIIEALHRLNDDLKERGSSLLVLHGKPLDIFSDLTKKYNVKGVYTNEDYEPYGLARDKEVSEMLSEKGITLFSFKDHVIFSKNSLLSGAGKPYGVFTPYSKKWKETLGVNDLKAYQSETIKDKWVVHNGGVVPRAEKLGFKTFRNIYKVPVLDHSLIVNYQLNRDFPAIDGTTLIGPHLRFGTISIRTCVRFACDTNQVWLNQLIWRDFFIQILWHFPRVVNTSYREKFDRIEWLNNEEDFERWKNGKTGVPIVDAGMRQLNQTGYMHNRVRMIVASFLSKHLLIDWRWGEAYFASKLLDYELASNNGNWQWAAGSGVDASPWFRIFNPVLQSLKFDPSGAYVRQWVPEFGTPRYTSLMINLDLGRKRCLEVFKRAVQE